MSFWLFIRVGIVVMPASLAASLLGSILMDLVMRSWASQIYRRVGSMAELRSVMQGSMRSFVRDHSLRSWLNLRLLQPRRVP